MLIKTFIEHVDVTMMTINMSKHDATSSCHNNQVFIVFCQLGGGTVNGDKTVNLVPCSRLGDRHCAL